MSRKYIYIWEGDGGCEECAALVGTEFHSEAEINPRPPLHPNCQCYISVLEIDDDGNVNPSNEEFESAMVKTFGSEGGYTKNEGRDDFPTNMGITQPTLNSYNKRHSKFNFPDKVRDLTRAQANQIYKEDFWNAGLFNEMQNERIRNAMFDMSVMTGPKYAAQVQEALNEFGAKVSVDGRMGNQTIMALNNIPRNKVNDFMDVMKGVRMRHLEHDSPRKWQENPGWIPRTARY